MGTVVLGCKMPSVSAHPSQGILPSPPEPAHPTLPQTLSFWGFAADLSGTASAWVTPGCPGLHPVLPW